MRLSFSTTPNARNVLGDPVTVSSNGKYRLLEFAGDGYFAHRSDGKRWYGVDGQPFGSRASAIAACQQLADGPAKRKRRREVPIVSDETLAVGRPQ